MESNTESNMGSNSSSHPNQSVVTTYWPFASKLFKTKNFAFLPGEVKSAGSAVSAAKRNCGDLKMGTVPLQCVHTGLINIHFLLF